MSAETYSARVCLIILFNLMVGVGSLAIPATIARCGLIYGLLLIYIVGFASYITTTFLVEVTASANAVLSVRSGAQPSKACFEMHQRVEVGHMASIFLPSVGARLFALVLILYLYCDLAIYAVSVVTTIQRVYFPNSGDDTFRAILLVFSVLLAPFCLSNFQKTRHLQYVTVTTRVVALLAMLGLAWNIVRTGSGVPFDDVPLRDWDGLKTAIGTVVFSFMLHHSLPGVMHPLEHKSQATSLILLCFVLIASIYSLLAASALLAFPAKALLPLYTLNFNPARAPNFATFLRLFPVFTLSSNFPLICITLRNNLTQFVSLPSTSTIITRSAKPPAPSPIDATALPLPPPLPALPPMDRRHSRTTLLAHLIPARRVLLMTLLALLPPLTLSAITHDLRMLISITGSMTGIAIMFFTPAALVVFSRRLTARLLPDVPNPYLSPFGGPAGTSLIVLVGLVALIVPSL